MDKNWHNQHFNHSTASQSSQGYCDACIIALYQRSHSFLSGLAGSQISGNRITHFNNSLSLHSLHSLPPCPYNCFQRNTLTIPYSESYSSQEQLYSTLPLNQIQPLQIQNINNNFNCININSMQSQQIRQSQCQFPTFSPSEINQFQHSTMNQSQSFNHSSFQIQQVQTDFISRTSFQQYSHVSDVNLTINHDQMGLLNLQPLNQGAFEFNDAVAFNQNLTTQNQPTNPIMNMVEKNEKNLLALPVSQNIKRHHRIAKEVQKKKKKEGNKQQLTNSNEEKQLQLINQGLKKGGWRMQSEQLLFEWNNTVLKQVSLKSEKIVKESVNVTSYVNILSKSRIMLISQDERSLKYQINLIDLSRERVICKHQLGSNFQLYPFEPSKLKVQTVKISERVSCIYLIGGSYFKLIDNRSLKNIKRVKQLCIQQVLPLHKGRQVVVLSLNGCINIYSTINDKFNIIRQIKIASNPQQPGLSYVNYFDVDTDHSLVYCCVLSPRSQSIQIFNLVNGEVIYSQEITILEKHFGYQITNMKFFKDHLYIELQLRQEEAVQLPNKRGIIDSDQRSQFPQYKVQAYSIDENHRLVESKTYEHSNILNSSFCSKQFFLYDSNKSCIIGFEKSQHQSQDKHNSSECIPFKNSEHYLSHDPTYFRKTVSTQSSEPTQMIQDQQIFKLNIKLTSLNHRPIFTHICKDIPHDSYDKHLQQGQNHTQNPLEQQIVLTLFDQNKNVYKIFEH